MLVGDSRGAWRRGTMPGAQFWDGERVVGQWLAAQDLGGLGYAAVVWDPCSRSGPAAAGPARPHGLLAPGWPGLARPAAPGPAPARASHPAGAWGRGRGG